MTKVTDAMLAAAMKKAVETQLLPRSADGETYLKTWQSMKEVLEAAIAAA